VRRVQKPISLNPVKCRTLQEDYNKKYHNNKAAVVLVTVSYCLVGRNWYTNSIIVHITITHRSLQEKDHNYKLAAAATAAVFVFLFHHIVWLTGGMYKPSMLKKFVVLFLADRSAFLVVELVLLTGIEPPAPWCTCARSGSTSDIPILLYAPPLHTEVYRKCTIITRTLIIAAVLVVVSTYYQLLFDYQEE